MMYINRLWRHHRNVFLKRCTLHIHKVTIFHHHHHHVPEGLGVFPVPVTIFLLFK